MRECTRCGKEFEPRKAGGRPQRFCSEACQRADYSKRMRAEGRMPEKRTGREMWERYGKAWKAANRPPKPMPEQQACRCCGQWFKPTSTQALYCSEGCGDRASRKRKYRRTVEMAKAGDGRSVAILERRRQQARAWRKAHGDHKNRAKRFGVKAESVVMVAVFVRDGWRCQICGRATPEGRRGTNHANAPELDHRVPLSRGGTHTYENVQCACRKCNRSKAASRAVGQLQMFPRPQELQKDPNGGMRRNRVG